MIMVMIGEDNLGLVILQFHSKMFTAVDSVDPIIFCGLCRFAVNKWIEMANRCP